MVDEIEDQWDQGFISDDERLERVMTLWTEAKNEVEQAMKDNLWRLNPIYMMADSGAPAVTTTTSPSSPACVA